MKEKLVDAPRRTVAGLLALLAVAGVIVGTVLAEGDGQRPRGAGAPAQQFSAERAETHLARIAAEPHPLGSPASDRIKDYLVGQLRSAGADVEVQRGVGTAAADGRATFGRVGNVVATLPGQDSTGSVVLTAHYDSVATGPGASDDGAAVAAILETVRALRDQGPLRNDLVLLLTDGEEDGLLGADAFARDHPLARGDGVVLNWEARGVSGPSLMFETSRDNARLVSLFTHAVPEPRGDSSMVEMYRLMPNDTDFSVLSKAGFAGLNSAYLEGSSYYHTADDTIANLAPSSLQHHGENMLSLARALGDAELPALATDDDQTYFRIFGTMVSYSNALVWPLAALAVVLVGVLVLVARRGGLISLPRVLLGAVSAVLPIVVSVLLAQGLWRLLVAIRPDYVLMGGLLHRPFAYYAALVVLVVSVILGWYLLSRRRIGPAALAIGGLCWPAVLGVVCAWFAPGASFVFALPALSGALGGIVASAVLRSPVWRVVAVVLGLVVPAALLPPLAWTTVHGLGLVLGGAGAGLLVLSGLTLLPIVELFLGHPSRGIGRWAGSGVALTSAVLVVALVAAGTRIDGVDERHPEHSHLTYVLNADTNTARWVSAEDEPTPWTKRFVNSQDTTALPAGYTREPLWTGPAKPLPVAGPEVTVRSRTADLVKIRVTSPRGASSVTLRVDQPITEATAVVPGLAPVTVPLTGTRTDGWPAEIRFRDLPKDGVELTLHTSDPGPIRITAIDESRGIDAVPGYVSRPPEIVATTREDSDLTTVARTIELTGP